MQQAEEDEAGRREALELASVAAELQSVEEKLAQLTPYCEERRQRVREACVRAYSARGESRRQNQRAELDLARKQVIDRMNQLFLNPPAAPLFKQAKPAQLPLEDLEARVAAELEVAQNGRSVASCVRSCSSRLYQTWGAFVFSALCYLFSIEEA